jgi:hypothetical protein
MYTALHNIIYIYVMQKHMQTTKISKRTTLYSRKKYVNYHTIHIHIYIIYHIQCHIGAPICQMSNIHYVYIYSHPSHTANSTTI